MARVKTRTAVAEYDAQEAMENIISGTSLVKTTPSAPVAVEERPATETVGQPDFTPEWIKRPSTRPKTTVAQCIVIDLNNRWNEKAMVDLKGADTSGYSWGYYGVQLPVLVEQTDGSLKPFHLPDEAGENSGRLYKASHPEGYRAAFKHRSNLLQKIQLGLMVALVLGMFFISYVLISYK